MYNGRTNKDLDVLISIYNDEHLFQREREILKTPKIQHENILKLIDFESTGISKYSWWLTFEQSSISVTLRDYLHANHVTYEQICKMGQSIASGLHHLHRIISNDGTVMSIAHRDINNCSILVKDKFSCVISNFSHSMRYVRGVIDLGGDIQVRNVTIICIIHVIKGWYCTLYGSRSTR